MRTVKPASLFDIAIAGLRRSDMRPSGAGSDAQLHRIITRMCNRPFIVLLGCVFFQLLIDREVRAQVPSPDQSTSSRSPGSEQGGQEIPTHSVPKYLPCPHQVRSFSELSHSFAFGHLPSQSEITGSWVLIGSWLYRDSKPDLNCAGIMRGKVLEWVMLAQGYSLGVSMAGTYLTSAFEPERRQDLTFTIDLGGESNPVLRCRLTHRHSLVCLGSTYYNGLEFRQIQVHCEPPTPNAQVHLQMQPMLCFPYRKKPASPHKR
jgi:hypothetical protein